MPRAAGPVVAVARLHFQGAGLGRLMVVAGVGVEKMGPVVMGADLLSCLRGKGAK